MPLDFSSLQSQVDTFAENEKAFHHLLKEQLAQALGALKRFSAATKAIRTEGEKEPKRIALPFQENLDQAFSPLITQPRYNLVCADGSQIIPDPHDVPVFALVNVGLVEMSSSAAAVSSNTISKLYKHNELYIDNELIGEDILNLERDVLEMRYLSERSCLLKGTTIALRDGLLELYHEPRSEKAYRERFLRYHTYLNAMQKDGTITAGYVDKPRSQMLTDLLRVCCARESKDQPCSSFFPDVVDRLLFEQILKAGKRSAIFENHAAANGIRLDLEKLPVYFFYLNVSQNEKAWIVRVEIPQWVATDERKVDVLQQVLLEQCAIMGSKPYPYYLHRAHETALVRQSEKEELKKQIERVLIQKGVSLEEKSYKQSAKDQPTHKIVER
ncbi:MAG: DNA double-strand break repair nuclease NurA [Chloroflexi bacterium]|nr:DNA double-strand break repair nuclease NurA [Chloroflexota bacterium]